MKREYIDIPIFTTYNEIINKNHTLSATQYKSFNIANENTKSVSDFLYRDLTRDDLGYEVGSEAYVDDSTFYFIKTKALQPETYLLDINKESFQCIIPKSFITSNLKRGDLIISKDSNVGEIAILDKDYPNCMLCGGIYKLPVKENKYYLLAFIKSELFRQQIDFIVPRGSTIRHGKKKFLECQIPIPNKNPENTVKYVELLMKSIINKEQEIHRKHSLILELIQKELEQNQNDTSFKYSLPNIAEIMALDRMDSSLYSEEFKEKENLITNYTFGYETLTELGYYGVRGTSLESKSIKNRIDSDTYKEGFYELIIPTNITKYGTVAKSSYIGTPVELKTISQGDIIFGGEGYGKGKSFVVIENTGNVATNYHGIRIRCNTKQSLNRKIFIKCFLSYLRERGLIDKYGVGGNGGHLAPAYFGLIKIPNFPENIEQEIVKMYYNNEVLYSPDMHTIDTFIQYDTSFNLSAGIYELDKSMKYLVRKLNNALANIADDIEVKCTF